MKTVLLFFTISISGAGSLFSQTAPEQVIDKFLANLAKKEVRKGLADFYSENKWITRQADQIENLASSLEKLTEDYMGKYYGSDFILKKSLNDRLVIYSYMARYERQPIRFIFKFYKPNDKWIPWSIAYDGALDEEMTEAAKIYRKSLD